MEGVRSGARGDVDDAAVESAELGGNVVGSTGERLNVVDDGEVDDLAGFGLQGGDAVEEILVSSRTAAIDARQDGAGRQFDAGSEGCELNEVARVQRHGDDGGPGDIGLYVAGCRLQQRGIAGDLDGLLISRSRSVSDRR